jgi:hypothetical protein
MEFLSDLLGPLNDFLGPHQPGVSAFNLSALLRKLETALEAAQEKKDKRRAQADHPWSGPYR